jgi:ankyrin repeat protein
VWKILCKQGSLETDLSHFYEETGEKFTFDQYGLTAVHYAAGSHYKDLLTLFHELKLNLDVPRIYSTYENYHDNTLFHHPLDLAIANNDFTLTALFLKNFGQKPTLPQSIFIAMNNNNREMLALLLKHMKNEGIYLLLDRVLSDVNSQVGLGLSFALSNVQLNLSFLVPNWQADLSKLNLLLDVLVDLDPPENKCAFLLNYQENMGETLFEKYCHKHRHIEMIEALLSHGADPNIVSKMRLYKETEHNHNPVYIDGSALMIGIFTENKKLINLLLRYNADPHQKLKVHLPPSSSNSFAKFWGHPKTLTPLEFAESKYPSIHKMMLATIKELKKSQGSGPPVKKR